MIGLRHDVDYYLGLRLGLPRLMELEKRYGVRSTIFVRVELLKSERDIALLKAAEEGGWEIGLHLANTINAKRALEELKELRSHGFNIRGVSPCGKRGGPGWRGGKTWSVMDRLNLEYICGYGKPTFKTQTCVFPVDHVTLDTLIETRGKDGYRVFKKLIQESLRRKGVASVLTHPEYFLFSVGHRLPTKIRVVEWPVKLLYTFLKKNMVPKYYEEFLSENARYCRTYIQLILHLERNEQ
ncbi:MAG: hypothetical protein ACTSXC_08945 [Candidatus Freyarchaeota archaeon]